jgi:DNA polymerase phi
VRDSLYKTLNLACQQAEHSMSAAQVKELLKIALQAVRLTRKIARPTDSVSSCWDAAEFDRIKMELASSERFKGSPAIQASAKQLSSLLLPSSAAQKEPGSKKRKGGNIGIVDGIANGAHEPEPRKKRKKVKKQKSE